MSSMQSSETAATLQGDPGVPTDGIPRGGSRRPAGLVGPVLDGAPLAIVVDLVRSGAAVTRPEIVTSSGLSRKVVAQRVEQALELGLLSEEGLAPSGGGRQARTLRFRAEAGHVFAAFVGGSEFTVAVADLAGSIIDSIHEDWPIERGPDATMRRLTEHLAVLSRRTGVDRPWGIGVGMPGPVDFETGRLVAPPIMPGWDGFSVRAWLRDQFDAPVWVENDVNLLAVGEWTRGSRSDGEDLLFIKIGTGVGAGWIVRGRLVRGQRGAAGDIGHTHVTDDPTRICRCGRVGCLEAVASGWSLLLDAQRRAGESPYFSERIAQRGHLTLGDVGAAVQAGDSLGTSLVDDAADPIAEVVANLVNFTNPGSLVIGGGALHVGPRLVERIATIVRSRATDLVARDLEIREASLDHREGIIGTALLAVENLFDPATLARWVEDGTPFARAVEVQRSGRAFD